MKLYCTVPNVILAMDRPFSAQNATIVEDDEEDDELDKEYYYSYRRGMSYECLSTARIAFNLNDPIAPLPNAVEEILQSTPHLLVRTSLMREVRGHE